MQDTDPYDTETARSYDTPGTGMFSSEVLEPTVRRLAELAAGGRALEFAIGTGRVAVPLGACGVPVVGVDTSGPMVAQLRTKADEQTIPVITGDMATVEAPGRFSLVYLVYNTISNLLTQAEQVACFRNAARHLSPGGRFVVELWVPELRKLPPGQHAVVWQPSRANRPGHLRRAGPAGRVAPFPVRRRAGRPSWPIPHRYIWPAELDLMAQLAGFELESRHADWTGAEFTAESRSHVSVYRTAEPRLRRNCPKAPTASRAGPATG